MVVLLARGVDPNVEFASVWGWQSGEPSLFVDSPLRAATTSEGDESAGRAEVVRALLDAGADPPFHDEHDLTPIAWSAFQGDYPGYVVLADAGNRAGMSAEDREAILATVDARSGSLRHRMRRVLDPSDATPLHAATRRGAAVGVARLIESGAEVDAAAEGDAWRPLHWAAGIEGDVECARLLLDAGADPLARTTDGYTPLFAAVEADCVERVRLLLAAGADPDAAVVDGNTSLHVAAARAALAVTRLLLEAGADPTVANASKRRPFEAARYGEHRSVEALLREAFDAAEWPQRWVDIELVTEEQGEDSPGSFSVGTIEAAPLGSATMARGSIWIDGSTLPIAFRIYWMIDEVGYEVGAFAAEAGETCAFSYDEVIRVEVPETIDILLQPDRRVAFRDLRTWRIWGERVVLHDVSVSRD